MFLSKRLFNKNFKDIKLTYVIIEVVLIFIGVTFANLAYEKSLQKKEGKFVLENLELFKNELKKSIDYNERSLIVYGDLQDDYEYFNSLFKNTNVTEEEILENQNKFMDITLGYLKIDEQIGLNNILNRDLNLIKDFEFITELIRFSRIVEHMNNSIDYYNDEINKLQNLIIEEISVDFHLFKVTGFKDLESLRKNTLFNNQLESVIYLRNHYLSDINILIEYFNKMIESINEYINNIQ